MVDRTVTQEIILAEQTQFKLKRSTATNYAIFDDIIDDSVQFTPEGNDAKKFEAISGKTLTANSVIKDLKTTFPVWVGANELELMRSAMGEPVTTGTGPYVHTFDLSLAAVNVDFIITGTRYGSATEKVAISGTGSAIKLTNLNIEKAGVWKMSCELTVPAKTCKVAVTSDTNMSTDT